MTSEQDRQLGRRAFTSGANRAQSGRGRWLNSSPS